MDVRGLDDRAARGDEPVEAGALRERADVAGVGTAGADFRDGREIGFDDVDVDGWCEHVQSRAIERDAAIEIAAGRAEDDHAGIEKLAAIDARNDAHDGVIKHEAFGHERRPPSRAAAAAGAPASAHDTRRGTARRSGIAAHRAATHWE